MYCRILGPVTAKTAIVNGRSYSGSPGSVYDIIDGDADVLCANGWTKISLSGPTSARLPTTQLGGYSAGAGTQYFDTTLSKLIVFDGATWRDPATGNGV